MSEERINFARTVTEWDLGAMASSVMTDCEKYGMTYGCTIDCPVLQAGECELQDSENKELYIEAMKVDTNEPTEGDRYV